MKYVVLVGRILYSLIFIMSGFAHFANHAMMTQYSASQGVPLPGIMVFVTGAMILLGGLSVLLGYKAKIGAGLLFVFLVPVAFMMHNFWAVTDPQMAGMQQAMFMKNISMAGAALLIFHFGSGPMSLDKSE